MSKMPDKRSGKPPIAPRSKVSSAPASAAPSPVAEPGGPIAESDAKTRSRQAAQTATNPQRQAFQKILNEARAAHPQIASARRRRPT